jgi:hypothetical protein
MVAVELFPVCGVHSQAICMFVNRYGLVTLLSPHGVRLWVMRKWARWQDSLKRSLNLRDLVYDGNLNDAHHRECAHL